MRLANLTDLQLATCNKWTLPSGVTKLAVPHTIPLYTEGPAPGALFPGIEISTPPDHDFICKVVSSTIITPGMLIRIQWPDGRYLSNPGIDFFKFVGTGRRGRLISPHKYLERAAKIKIDISAASTASPTGYVEIYFEGVLLVDLI